MSKERSVRLAVDDEQAGDWRSAFRCRERGSGRKQFEDRHKREVRRYRTDEIRAGLTELSRRYRDDLAASARPADVAASIDDIAELASNLVRNPNERLQLVALFSKLGRPRR